ncbi:hypothetical protein [Aureimonas sp. SK2]|uniref:hypothetical protein n=1 Tax=Aureimonas sp. SK2 TaxID=3015992 RepID=UPI0024445D02|nr:hypothetical protein [Aureimonas sp. SK2]
MTGHPDWSPHQTERAQYLAGVGTPIDRIAEEGGVTVPIARARILEARRLGPVIPAGMPEAMDAYLSFLGIDGAEA